MSDIITELHGSRQGQVQCHACGAWHIEEAVTPVRLLGDFPHDYLLHWYCPLCHHLMMTRTVLEDGRTLERTRKSVLIKEARK